MESKEVDVAQSLSAEEEMYDAVGRSFHESDADILPDKSLSYVPHKGLSILTCALFIVAAMAGSGVLALPAAVVSSGWTGVGLIVLCCFISLYCGIRLGQCWIILRKRQPIYREAVRDPYPVIGWEAGGKGGKIVVQVCVLGTLFGVSVVFLLLASQNIASLINSSLGSISVKDEFRIWLLICSGVLLPFTYLGTPKDFWGFALGAVLCTATACLLIIIKSGIDIPEDVSSVNRGDVTALSFFKAFGTIAFSFGGAALFPTFQTDMKVQNDFPKAATAAFVTVLVMYFPTSVIPFIAYGAQVKENVLLTFSNYPGYEGLAVAAKVLITGHLLFSLVITLNPISLQMEELFKTPHKFGISRLIIRTAVMLLVLGVAEAVPHFGPILSLIGGSTVTMMSFILPLVFYFKLADNIPLHIKVLHVEIILIALMSGCISTYSAILAIKDTF